MSQTQDSGTSPARQAHKAWVRALELTARNANSGARCLSVAIDEYAERFGEAPALLSDEQSLSYRQLALRCHRYAHWARHEGLEKGDVVALALENCPDYLAAWLGLTRAGVVVALLNTNLRAEALIHAARLVAPRHIIIGQELWEPLSLSLGVLPARLWQHGEQARAQRLETVLEALPDTALTDEECAFPEEQAHALYIYTSGTTGMPKAARVSHFRVMQWSQWFAGMMGTGPGDRLYNCLPMYHSVGGIVAVGACLVAGAAVVVRRRFSATHFWSDLQGWDCNLFQYIGELCRILVNAPTQAAETGHRLRMVCGNGLAADVWERFKERFRIPQILEFYAATEANFSLFNCEGRVGSIGRVPPYLAHRFPVELVEFDVESGLPARDSSGRCRRCATDVAGEAISQISENPQHPTRRFEGYSDAGASDAKVLRDVFTPGDAWYRSGDLMRRDAAGFFYFVDRVGDSFRWNGENVSSTEVAAALTGHPGITDALVYGVAVPGRDGRAGMAALITGAGFDLEGLWLHLEQTLPRYARPRFVRILRQLDLTGTFKPRKQELMAAGFDPRLIDEPLYVSDLDAARFVALDGDTYERLAAGTWRV